MGKTADFFADEDVPRARVALLLEHFSRLEDDREPWRIVYPLSEVLLLLTCATIASCDEVNSDRVAPLSSLSSVVREHTVARFIDAIVIYEVDRITGPPALVHRSTSTRSPPLAITISIS
jgi:hypothetical protein